MSNTLTMLDVFRSMHSMNVEDVRQLFITNFNQIIGEKDSKIDRLERQLCAVNSSGYKCANCAKLAHDIDNVTKQCQNSINGYQRIANRDKELIDSLNARIESLNGVLTWTREQLASVQRQRDLVVAEKAQLEFDRKNLEQSLTSSGLELSRLKTVIDELRTTIQTHESKATVQRLIATKMKNHFNISDQQMDQWIMDAYLGF